MSSALLVFDLYLNHMSHPTMFLTSYLRKMRTNMDDLLDDITGLVGICLLPEPDD